MREKLKYLIAVNMMYFVYSFMSIFGKLAAREGEINFIFLVFYGGSLLTMGVYALCWQRIIKKLPLMVAYTNKAVVIVWGLLWGILFFNESVTPGKLAGVVLVIIGVVLFSMSENEATA